MAPFQQNLTELLLRMCQGPSLPLPLRRLCSDQDGADAKAALNRQGSRSSLAPPEPSVSSQSPQILRSAAAEKIWSQIKRRPSLAKRIKTFESFAWHMSSGPSSTSRLVQTVTFKATAPSRKGPLRTPPSGELRLARMRNLDVRWRRLNSTSIYLQVRDLRVHRSIQRDIHDSWRHPLAQDQRMYRERR